MDRCVLLLFSMVLSFYSFGQTLEVSDADVSYTEFTSSLQTLGGLSNNHMRGSSFIFIRNLREVDGSVHVFKKWDNKGIVIVDEEQKFSIDNINFNALSNQIESKIDESKVYIFDFNFVEDIFINNRRFSSYKLHGDNRVFEVIYSDNSFSILKDYKASIKKKDPDPLMLTQHKEEHIIKSKLYVIRNGNFEKFKFSKRNFLNQFDKSSKNDIQKFIKENKLSLKDPYHMRDIAKYAMSLQTK